jgi:hypothetical protein
MNRIVLPRNVTGLVGNLGSMDLQADLNRESKEQGLLSTIRGGTCAGLLVKVGRRSGVLRAAVVCTADFWAVGVCGWDQVLRLKQQKFMRTIWGRVIWQ